MIHFPFWHTWTTVAVENGRYPPGCFNAGAPWTMFLQTCPCGKIRKQVIIGTWRLEDVRG